MKTKHLLIIWFIASVAFTGCGFFSNPCKDVDCGANGQCVDGVCRCNDGWMDAGTPCSQRIPCYGVDCGHGTCNELNESCDCDQYWERSADSTCNTLQRQKFLGSWTGSHTENGTNVGPYTITITEGLDIDQVLVTNVLNDMCFGNPLQGTCELISATQFTYFTFNCGNYQSNYLMLSLFSTDQITLNGGVSVNGNNFNITGLFTRQ